MSKLTSKNKNIVLPINPNTPAELQNVNPLGLKDNHNNINYEAIIKQKNNIIDRIRQQNRQLKYFIEYEELRQIQKSNRKSEDGEFQSLLKIHKQNEQNIKQLSKFKQMILYFQQLLSEIKIEKQNLAQQLQQKDIELQKVHERELSYQQQISKYQSSLEELVTKKLEIENVNCNLVQSLQKAVNQNKKLQLNKNKQITTYRLENEKLLQYQIQLKNLEERSQIYQNKINEYMVKVSEAQTKYNEISVKYKICEKQHKYYKECKQESDQTIKNLELEVNQLKYEIEYSKEVEKNQIEKQRKNLQKQKKQLKAKIQKISAMFAEQKENLKEFNSQLQHENKILQEKIEQLNLALVEEQKNLKKVTAQLNQIIQSERDKNNLDSKQLNAKIINIHQEYKAKIKQCYNEYNSQTQKLINQIKISECRHKAQTEVLNHQALGLNNQLIEKTEEIKRLNGKLQIVTKQLQQLSLHQQDLKQQVIEFQTFRARCSQRDEIETTKKTELIRAAEEEKTQLIKRYEQRITHLDSQKKEKVFQIEKLIKQNERMTIEIHQLKKSIMESDIKQKKFKDSYNQIHAELKTMIEKYDEIERSDYKKSKEIEELKVVVEEYETEIKNLKSEVKIIQKYEQLIDQYKRQQSEYNEASQQNKQYETIIKSNSQHIEQLKQQLGITLNKLKNLTDKQITTNSQKDRVFKQTIRQKQTTIQNLINYNKKLLHKFDIVEAELNQFKHLLQQLKIEKEVFSEQMRLQKQQHQKCKESYQSLKKEFQEQAENTKKSIEQCVKEKQRSETRLKQEYNKQILEVTETLYLVNAELNNCKTDKQNIKKYSEQLKLALVEQKQCLNTANSDHQKKFRQMQLTLSEQNESIRYKQRELSKLHNDISRLNEEVRQQSVKIQKLQHQYTRTAEMLSCKDTELLNLRLERSSYTENIKVMETYINQFNAEKSELVQKCEKYKTEMKELNAIFTQIKNENEHKNNQISYLNLELKNATQKSNQLTKATQSIKCLHKSESLRYFNIKTERDLRLHELEEYKIKLELVQNQKKNIEQVFNAQLHQRNKIIEELVKQKNASKR